MALHLLPSEALRTACRQRLEACEMWLRRLLHDKLSAEYGSNYVQESLLNGQALFSNECRVRSASRIADSPARYPRPVDALLLDDLAALIGKEDVFKTLFANCFHAEFPLGRMHVRLTLSRLVPIRNALSHANPVSNHDAERALCYCSDLIGAISAYYESIGMSHEFNAPSITRFSDSLGNVAQPASARDHLVLKNGPALRSGMHLRCEVEVDSSFDISEYSVQWNIHGRPAQSFQGNALALTLEDRHVGEILLVVAQVKSTKLWHRLVHFDAELNVQYRVLPPL